MAQEGGDSDLSTTFSTLNVNAMEFVPSFCSNAPTGTTPEAAAAAATPAETPTDEPAPTEAPTSQDASPTKTDEEQPVSVAAPTESIDDKSPDNPGLYHSIFSRFKERVLFIVFLLIPVQSGLIQLSFLVDLTSHLSLKKFI